MNPIRQALNAKISPQDILEYLTSRYPALRDKITYAVSMGATSEDLIKYLQGFDGASFRKMSNTPMSKKSRADLEFEVTRRGRKLTQGEMADFVERDKQQQTQEKIKTAGKFAVGLGVNAAAGYAAGKVVQHVPQIAKLPIVRDFLNNNRTAQTIAGAFGYEQAVPHEQQPSVPATIPDAPISPPAEPPQTPSSDLIRNLRLESKVDAMHKAGNPPATIAAALHSSIGIELKKSIDREDLENSVQAYLQERESGQAQPPQVEPPQAGASIQPQQPQTQQPIESQQPIQEPPETPQVLAMTPSGDLGSVKHSDEEKGVLTLDLDGKEKKFKKDDVIESPIPQRDLVDIYEELTQAIPESERSSVINWAGYDANHNELAFRPHGGAMYIYKDIPQEFADKLKDSMFKAKTTGESFYGAWKEGDKSRFAGLSVLIRELQKLYGGKGKEYVRKYETAHDFLALPHQAKKEREKKIREENKKNKRKK